MFVTPVEHLLTALRKVLDVPIYTKVPMHPEDLFLRLDVTSNEMTSPSSQETTIAVQTYGVDQDDTINLMGALRFILADEIYARNPKILWWEELTGPVEFPDPDTDNHYRWQLTGTMTTTLT